MRDRKMKVYNFKKNLGYQQHRARKNLEAFEMTCLCSEYHGQKNIRTSLAILKRSHTYVELMIIARSNKD